MNEPPRKEYVIRLLYTLLGRQQGVEYDKVFYTDKDDVEHEEKLAKRRRSCENAAQRCKDYLSHALDGEKLKTARVSVFYKSNESVTIDDLGSLSEEYIRIPEPQADKTAIKKAIKAGKEVAGAHLETSKSVIVR